MAKPKKQKQQKPKTPKYKTLAVTEGGGVAARKPAAKKPQKAKPKTVAKKPGTKKAVAAKSPAFKPGQYGAEWGMSGWNYGSGPFTGTQAAKDKHPKGIKNWKPRPKSGRGTASNA